MWSAPLYQACVRLTDGNSPSTFLVLSSRINDAAPRAPKFYDVLVLFDGGIGWITVFSLAEVLSTVLVSCE